MVFWLKKNKTKQKRHLTNNDRYVAVNMSKIEQTEITTTTITTTAITSSSSNSANLSPSDQLINKVTFALWVICNL